MVNQNFSDTAVHVIIKFNGPDSILNSFVRLVLGFIAFPIAINNDTTTSKMYFFVEFQWSNICYTVAGTFQQCMAKQCVGAKRTVQQ